MRCVKITAVALAVLAVAVPVTAQTTVFINEFHYDNSGTDAGEAIEVAGPAGTDLTSWSIVLYNGNGGASYDTTALSGTIADICGGWGVVDVTYPTNGIQNGAPDGIALVDDSDTVVQFLSYEGSFTATGGPADGMTSTDIGVAESSGTAIGDSLQLTGTGSASDDFIWTGPAADSFGACNTGQSFTAPSVDLVINEIDADTAGSDALEFVELYDGGVGNSALDGFVVVLHNGSDDASYAAYDLDGYTTDSGGYFLLGNAGVSPAPDIVFPGNGLQNGADAVALYKGDAADFPNDTPVTTDNLVDAIVYDTNDSDDPGLLVLLNAGQPQVNEDGNGDKDNHSNQRCPNGEGGERNTTTYIQAAPTPAGANECGSPPVDLFINEVDADTAGTDTLEFVELYDGGAGSTPLDGFVVVLYNGSDDQSYLAYDLDGFSTDANGFFVLGNSGVSPTPGITFPSNTLQNGADAVALFIGDSADFPNDTPLTTDNLVDAIVYDTNDGDDPALLVLLNAGQPQVNEDGNGDKDNHSNQRCPNGEGGARNTDTYLQLTPTPGTINLCNVPSDAVLVINEIDYDQPGTDSAEFIEIKNTTDAPVNLGTYTLKLINGSNDLEYQSFDLPAVDLAPSEYFVVCGDAATVVNCDLDVDPDSNLVQNGSPDAVALLEGATVIDTVSYEGAVAAPYTEGSGAVADSGSSGNDFLGISRLPDGFDSNRNDLDFAFVCITPGAANTATDTNCNVLAEPVEIFEIQGAGSASPFDGFVVTTLDNVVTATGPSGFFIQTPSARADGIIDTSDGIFVYTGGAPSVAVGDQVDVTGEVDEFYDMTEFTNSPVVTVDSAGNALPPAVVFDASVPSPDPAAPSCAIEYECYEGMLIEIADGTVTGPNQHYGSDPIAEVHVVAYPHRAFREPGIEFPGEAGYPVWDGNPEIFELDPDKLGLDNQIIPAYSAFSATGVMGFEFGDYEFWPSDLAVTPAPLPVAVWPREAGEFTVATLNLFRLFDDIDDAPDTDFDPPRDDQVVSAAEYQLRLDKFSAHIREVLDAPDILAVQEAEKLGVLEDLAARIATDDPAISYTAYLVEGNDIGTIDVGFMVRDRIQVDAITQLGKEEILTYDGSWLHDRPPLLLEGSCQLEFGSSPIAVLAVHMRSLGGIDSPSDGERVRQKRFEQAESVANMVQDIQITTPDVRLIVAGDFNAFEFTDGYVDVVGIIKGDFEPADNLICGDVACADLVDPDLTNEVLNVPVDERYSFVFHGSAQVLDHALTGVGIAPEISGVVYGRGNADAAEALIDDDGTEADPALRSSDHDGLVVYVLNDEDNDGVPNDLDLCSGTVIPESVPTRRLRILRWALVDEDGEFDTRLPRRRLGFSDLSFTLGDTAGCSCEQIIEELHLGKGHTKFGCSLGAMKRWVRQVSDEN